MRGGAEGELFPVWSSSAAPTCIEQCHLSDAASRSHAHGLLGSARPGIPQQRGTAAELKRSAAPPLTPFTWYQPQDENLPHYPLVGTVWFGSGGSGVAAC